MIVLDMNDLGLGLRFSGSHSDELHTRRRFLVFHVVTESAIFSF